jgi:TIR domain
MSDIFISYARENLESARRLAAALEEQGWSVFWDRTIPAGKDWREVIGAALADARCVVVLWSPHSVNSRFVIEESDRGLRRRVLIPAFIERTEPPFGFGTIHAADLSEWGGDRDDAAIQLFFRDVAGILGPAPVLNAEQRREAEAESKRKAEQQQRQQAEAAAKRKAEEERQRAEAEAKRKAEEERQRAEAEAKRRAEGERQRGGPRPSATPRRSVGGPKQRPSATPRRRGSGRRQRRNAKPRRRGSGRRQRRNAEPRRSGSGRRPRPNAEPRRTGGGLALALHRQ